MELRAGGGRSHVSALACFPKHVAKEVAGAVAATLKPGARSPLRTDAQVRWTMEVLCFGLSLPPDCETARACVDIYTHWLTVLASPRDSIPPPIVKEPNLYVQKILRHLRALFLPGSDRPGPALASVCQRVLTAIRLLAREGAGVSADTWEMLLHFLLCVNQALLATPTSAPTCQPLSLPSMEVLFQVTLLSCSRCFPPRSFWLSWRQMMTSWRFHLAVLDQWTRVVSALTSRLLRQSLGPAFPQFKVPGEDVALIPEDMGRHVTLQSWFRFLHLPGNPADLRRPPVDGPAPPAQQDVFLTAMSTISRLVDAFLGVSVICGEPGERMLMNAGGLSTRIHFRDRLPSLGVAVTRSPFKDRLPAYGVSRPRSGSAPPTPANVLSVPSKSPPPPHARQKTSNISKAAGKPELASSQTSPSLHPRKAPSGLPEASWVLYSSPRGPPSPLRGSVDSLLHLFGSCLFEAALVDKESAPSERWEDGRAEACGTLCRIFSSKKTFEDILPVYLSRFYAVLLQGLRVCEKMSPPVVSSILLHSSSLFCCDLAGVNLLLPSFVSALEKVLLEREVLSFRASASSADLRRAAILLLMSLLPLPQQFGQVQLAPLPATGDVSVGAGSCQSLKPRLVSLLIGSLRSETDSTNTQMLLAAVWTLVQDCALMEAEEQTQQTRKTGRAADKSGRAVALWVDVMHLLTQHLTARWRDESAVCLVATEVLAGLARVKVAVAKPEKKHAVTSICRFIEFQCGRPPPLHSRDLHSIIVAAFHCLSTWIAGHPDILEDQECLMALLEMVELGVSGSKSRQEGEVRYREEKDLNPVSLRVKEAAEATLNCIMQVSGASPSFGSTLDEDAPVGFSAPSDRTLEKFKYFALDTSVILAILEQDRGSDQGPASCPSLVVLIRGQFSHHAWTFQHRLQPREGKTSPKRAISLQQCGSGEARAHAGISHCGAGVKKPTPLENIYAVPLVEADMSIPDLWEGLSEEAKRDLDRFQGILEQQRRVEQELLSSAAMTTCAPPPSHPLPATRVQTSRPFLSHLGLVTPETLKDLGSGGVPAQLVSLDSSLPGFFEDLRRLDRLPFRAQDSAFVFYVRAGQKTASEILQNVELRVNVSHHFLDFLSSLGRPVATTGRRHEIIEFAAALGQSGGRAFDGERLVLKYRDSLTDLTFVVPSSSRHESALRRSAEDGHKCKMIVWVERLEDIDAFLDCQLTTGQAWSCVQAVFVHSMRSGLFRMVTRGSPAGKSALLPPLVDGMVVGKRLLGPSAVETLLNGCRRRQRCVDRKSLISEAVARYRSRRSEPADFYGALFRRA